MLKRVKQNFAAYVGLMFILILFSFPDFQVKPFVFTLAFTCLLLLLDYFNFLEEP
jgi:hypothetical protein